MKWKSFRPEFSTKPLTQSSWQSSTASSCSATMSLSKSSRLNPPLPAVSTVVDRRRNGVSVRVCAALVIARSALAAVDGTGAEPLSLLSSRSWHFSASPSSSLAPWFASVPLRPSLWCRTPMFALHWTRKSPWRPPLDVRQMKLLVSASSRELLAPDIEQRSTKVWRSVRTFPPCVGAESDSAALVLARRGQNILLLSPLSVTSRDGRVLAFGSSADAALPPLLVRSLESKNCSWRWRAPAASRTCSISRTFDGAAL